ncbi:Asp23/Gls24 family envelope stress response protein [Amycolatopsis thermalba]|uniref:Asp23/Gls24 family envelope stress response protein n=1 Tax=Amycolatopsis thermalba TaxID=944492 RepID=UPI000E22BC32|nr:Asp23/Gls24 family envelope stress response protein [Amycolatopsis thermalba]
MTTPPVQNASVNSPSGGNTGSPSQLVTEQGSTSIADAVVQKIAGLAASEIAGVHALGGGAAWAFGALRERIPGASASAGQGVSVEVGERQTAVDLELVVEYGVSIVDLARSVRRNVITAIERMTGLEVVEVNIAVNDVHLPDEEAEPEQTRLQ